MSRSRKGKLFSRIPPSAKQKYHRIKKLAAEAGQAELVALVDEFFDERVRNAFSHSDYIITDKYFRFNEGGLAQQIDVEMLDRLLENLSPFLEPFSTFTGNGQGRWDVLNDFTNGRTMRCSNY